MSKTLESVRSSSLFGKNRDRLARDTSRVAEDAGDLLHEITAEVGGKIDEAKASLEQAQRAVSGRTRKTVRTVDEYARENPWKTVGMAAAVALVAGILLTRR